MAHTHPPTVVEAFTVHCHKIVAEIQSFQQYLRFGGFSMCRTVQIPAHSQTLSISPIVTIASIAPNDGDVAILPRESVHNLRHHLRCVGRIAKALDPLPEKTTRTQTASAALMPTGATVNTAYTATQLASRQPDLVNRTCRKCHAVLASRNALFQHIYGNECSQPLKSTPAMPSVNRPSRLPSPHNHRWAVPYTQHQPPRSPSARSSQLAVHPLRQPTIPPANSVPASQPATQSVLGEATIQPASQSNHHEPIVIEDSLSERPNSRWAHPASFPLPLPSTPRQPSRSPAARSSRLASPSPSHSFSSRSSHCQQCGEAFQSRNELFRHLHAEKHKRPASASRAELTASWMIENSSHRRRKQILGQEEVLGRLEDLVNDVGSQTPGDSQSGCRI